MRRKCVNSASDVKTALTIATTISYKRTKIVAIWQQCKQFLGIFLPRMRRNSCFRNFRTKISACHSLQRPQFPTRQMHFLLPSDVYWIYSMFLCYNVAWLCDLDLWPFDLESVSCTVLLMSANILIFIFPRLSVTELRVLNIW